MMPPTAGMTYPVIDGILNKPLTVSARKIGTIYQWTPSTGLSDPASSSPVLFVSRQQTYRVSIRNEAGCVTTDTVHIRVHSEKNIHVPKGFTPNNDGHNEKLYPILVGIKILKAFRIYNRWGLLMYDNKDAGINNGWDGKYRGKPQPTETYAWIAEGIDDDGNPIRRSGNTILIR
jgi:gliding motility-associated-like protein